MSQFANNIKARRKEKGFTQDELAKILSVSRNSISNWETGKNYPDFGLLIAISDSLEISLDVLIKEDYELMQHVVKNERLSKKRKRVLSVLIPIFAIFVIFFVINIFHLNVSEITQKDIKSAKIEDNILTVEVELNKFESIAAWMIDGESGGKRALSISKDFRISNFFKKNKEAYVEIPLKRYDAEPNGNDDEIFLVNTDEVLDLD